MFAWADIVISGWACRRISRFRNCREVKVVADGEKAEWTVEGPRYSSGDGVKNWSFEIVEK
jgi:hypothetical protein